MAEVDGNRTRRRGSATTTRFEGGGAHQVPRHLRRGSYLVDARDLARRACGQCCRGGEVREKSATLDNTPRHEATLSDRSRHERALLTEQMQEALTRLVEAADSRRRGARRSGLCWIGAATRSERPGVLSRG